ncbi:hypothetical protein PHLCEN_2v6603 [Hermanssonia centrifuga]|uniref:Uncharacterized protein n=1 Tax=Hermanssonia centrifuga TaxID=98765 RepID=A0A2R6NYY7_9APHY|nr:hypothetical protein PHLCEN_2v6603 [Hermanssonia centrifuga]
MSMYIRPGGEPNNDLWTGPFDSISHSRPPAPNVLHASHHSSSRASGTISWVPLPTIPEPRRLSATVPPLPSVDSMSTALSALSVISGHSATSVRTACSSRSAAIEVPLDFEYAGEAEGEGNDEIPEPEPARKTCARGTKTTTATKGKGCELDVIAAPTTAKRVNRGGKRKGGA